jgi:hypothetical protein
MQVVLADRPNRDDENDYTAAVALGGCILTEQIVGEASDDRVVVREG